MAATDAPLLSLNAGEVSVLGLARIDLAKLRVACQSQLNFLPRVLGPCEFRPGTQQLGGVAGNLAGKLLEFVFDQVTQALLVLTPLAMQIMEDDAFIVRGAVTAAIANGNFATDLSSWTAADQAGAASSWGGAGVMALLGTGADYAYRDQEVTVNEPNTEHALRINIGHGIVTLQVGTSEGDDTYLDVTLVEGWHSLAFIPTGNFWIRLGADTAWTSTVLSIEVEGAGVVQIPTTWEAGDLGNIFFDQSEDVLFIACLGQRQSQIQRRTQRGWSVVRYYADDGPFLLPNLTPITLTPGAVTGNTTLVASANYFQPGHVGALFSLTQSGQQAVATLGMAGQATGTIRVSGLSNINPGDPAASQRAFAISISGTFDATVTLQSSLGVVGDWNDVNSFTTPQLFNYDDGLDNQVVFYRLIIKAGNYTSGVAACSLTYAESIQVGICRITTVVDGENATADILQPFGSTAATTTWSEGEWSTWQGFPADLAFHEGRLFQGTGVALDGSVSDAYASYDATVIGDAGPIDQSVTTGGADGIRWLLSLQRLIAGTAQQQVSIRAADYDYPITPTSFVARTCATWGAARVRPVKIDMIGLFVGRDACRVFKLIFEFQFSDFRAHELTRLKQEMCAAGIVDLALQSYPDRRIWFVLADGTCAVLTYDEEDDVAAWTPATTQGNFERVAAMPGSGLEDNVYFIVSRTIEGVTQRFVEKLAMRTQCQGATLNMNVDCFGSYTGAPTNEISAPWLAGCDVVVWADGAPRVTAAAPVTLDGSGNATLPGAPFSNAVFGLSYTGQLETAKLAYGADRGTALTMPKKVAKVGLVMANTAPAGIRIGRDFSNLHNLPATYRGRPLNSSEVLAAYDDVPSAFAGGWNPDSRVCLQVSSPYPCTLMGLAVDMETEEPNLPDEGPAGSPRGMLGRP